VNKFSTIGDAPHSLRLFPSTVPFGKPEAELAGSVAVIMRTKNRPLLLHRALSSVLCQTHSKWHLYLVNDGGDRAELERLLASYNAAFGDRLTVIHHAASLGMENASNAGLSRAQEEFVVVHDDDDSWHPEFLEATTSFLSDPANEHCVGVTTGCALITERFGDGEVEEIRRTAWSDNRGLINLGALLTENKFPPICLLFRRAAVERIGQFNGALPVLGDWEFNIRLLMVGEIDFLDRELARYHHREHGGEAAYGNTVVDGRARHERQNMLLRNSILRTAIVEQPGTLGVVQALLLAQREMREAAAGSIPEIERRLGAIEATLRQMDLAASIERRVELIQATVGDIALVASWVRKMLRPMHWVWVRALPLRRRIARARGRV
jgi:glycosyltransferase involved in cell wall biosynthesis